MRILMVENHAEFSSVVVPTFLAEHDVMVTGSVATAREAVAGGAFDVVLVDFDLENGKGDTLVRWLASRAGAPAIVAISARESGNDALLEAGATAVCSKLHFDQIGGVLARIAANLPFRAP
jgi:DNA-binding response OmpR family regulator